MKYFVCSDIHSHFNEFKLSLKKSGYDRKNPGHKLIILGNYFDKGNQAREMKKFLLKTKAICLRGNHDDFLIRIYDSSYLKKHDFKDGTYNTICQLCGLDKEDFNTPVIINKFKRCNEDLIDKMINMPYYIVIGKTLFVHSWIPENENDYSEDAWHKATMTNLNNLTKKICQDFLPEMGKFKNIETVVFGHYPAVSLDCMNEYDGQGINTDMIRQYKGKYINLYAIDGNVNSTGKIPILILED